MKISVLFRLVILCIVASSSMLPKTSWALAFDFNGDLRWAGGVVPYVFDANVTAEHRAVAERAMWAWQRVANVNFVKRGSQPDYVKISTSVFDGVNFSWVAKSGGEQPLWISNWDLHTVAHELGHALGACHEHQRSDRDNYVLASGWLPSTDINFTKLDGGFWAAGALSDNRTPYDYFSIMHYGAKYLYCYPWVNNVLEPKFATVGDMPDANPMAANFDPGLPLTGVIGVLWDDQDGYGFQDYLSIWDRQGMQSEYGISSTARGRVSIDGTTVRGMYPAGITLKLTGSGNAVDAAKRVRPNPINENSSGASGFAYKFEGLPSGKYTITPKLDGYYFTPKSKTITISGSGQTLEDLNFILSQFETAPPVLNFASHWTNGLSFKDAPVVSGTASDVGAGVKEVRLALYSDEKAAWYDFPGNRWGTDQFDFGKNMIRANGTTAWFYTLPALTDGTYQVHAQAVDNQDNGMDPWEFRSFAIDNAPPRVTVFVPAADTPYSELPIARGAASDDNSAVREVRVALVDSATGKWWRWNAGSWGTTTFDFASNSRLASKVPDWEAALPTLPPGDYQLHVQSVDTADNGSTWEFSRFKIDRTPAQVWFNGLTNQQHFFDFKALSGAISEPGSVAFRITEFNFDGVPDRKWNAYTWVTTATPGVELPTTVEGLQWRPSADAPTPTRGQTRQGFYIVDLVARDVAGNVSTTNIVLYRTGVDKTLPDSTIDTISPGQEFTNRVLPTIGGAALDPESGISSVNVYFMRFASGEISYWNGTGWTAEPATLTSSLSGGRWQLSSPAPSGGSLPNGNYHIQVSASNGESPSGTRGVSVSFSVDYHPVYLWTAGSFSDSDQHNNNQLWNNPANWSPAEVPEDGSVVNIFGGEPDARAMQVITLHALNLSSGRLNVTDIRIKKLSLEGALIGGNIELNGENASATWTGGVIAGRFKVPTGAVVTVSGRDIKELSDSAVMMNFGRVVWNGGGPIASRSYYGPSFLTNSGVFEVTGSGQVFGRISGYYPFVFVNGETASFSKTTAPGEAVVSNTLFVQRGTVASESGRMIFDCSLVLTDGNIFTGGATNVVRGGEATINGQTTIDASLLEITGGVLVGAVDGNGFLGTSNGGQVHVYGGTFRNKVSLAKKSATTVLQPGPELDNSATLANYGNVEWKSGTIAAPAYYNISTIRNEEGGVFRITGPTLLRRHNSYYLPVFQNESGAQLIFSLQGTNVWEGFALANRGLVAGEKGVLTLAQGGSSASPFSNASPAELRFTGGVFIAMEGASFTGDGLFRISGGTVTASGRVPVGAIEGSGRFAQESGLLNGSGMVLHGQFDWTGGTIGGVLTNAASGIFRVSRGDTILDNGASICNEGRLEHEPGALINAQCYYSGATLLNLPGALFEVRGGGQLFSRRNGYYTPGFTNFAGAVILKSNGTNSVLNSWSLFNDGEIRCETNALVLNALSGFRHGSLITGAGAIRTEGGETAFSGRTTVYGSLVHAGGTIVGSGTNAAVATTASGTFEWQEGALAGTLLIPQGSRFRLTGQGVKRMNDYAVLDNAGVIQHELGGKLMIAGYYNTSTINNWPGARYEFLGDGVAWGYFNGYYAGVFNNYAGATLSKMSGADTALQDFVVNNWGTLESRSGKLRLKRLVNLYDRGRCVGPGVLELSDVEAKLAGQTTISNGSLEFASGVLSGNTTNSTFVSQDSGRFVWSGGTMSGTLSLANGCLAEIVGDGDKVFDNHAVLNNAGTLLLRGGGRVMAQGYYGPSWLNNLPSGVVEVLSKGSWMRYHGYYATKWQNDGLLKVTSPGASFESDWDYVQTSGGRLQVAITEEEVSKARARFSNVALAGALQVDFGSGFQLGTNVASILAYSSRNGQMELAPGTHWTVVYGDNALTLRAASTPILGSTAFSADGTFRMVFSGAPAAAAILEASEDLDAWVPVATNSPFNGNVQFSDSGARAYDKRYYRVRFTP